MSGFKNVIIIGASGNIGVPVLDTFLKESSFKTTVLSREGSSSTFPSTVKVIHANYDSPDSLKKALEGQDVVISLVAGVALGDQNKFIDAAIAAGVKRYVPSEFGSNTTDARTRAIVPVFEAKYGTVNYLKSKEKDISWTSFVTGPFFDWGLKVGFLGLNLASKSANIYDNGTATFSSTNLHTIALSIIKALEKADVSKNQYVFVSGFQTSQKEILEVAEKVTGEKWNVTHGSGKALIEEGQAKLQKGDFSGILNLIQGATFEAGEQLGDLSPEGLWNEKLGLPKDDLEKTIRAALEG
ncbi:isoflavone reductase family protein [Ophiobolus disseminans]|uniref:Isoflavone reductase family protein n=1 Tax=Ophiobolus disseminans TaxID=1469910 RepID=A0A6A7ABK5_9PLEO|nr:isoflavone reductase family protein [Ophiobolus disseminans]